MRRLRRALPNGERLAADAPGTIVRGGRQGRRNSAIATSRSSSGFAIILQLPKFGAPPQLLLRRWEKDTGGPENSFRHQNCKGECKCLSTHRQHLLPEERAVLAGQ